MSALVASMLCSECSIELNVVDFTPPPPPELFALDVYHSVSQGLCEKAQLFLFSLVNFDKSEMFPIQF